MRSERQTVGFDRDIRLAWLDATAEAVAQGLGVSEVRARLDAVLTGVVPGEGVHSSRGKTETVLLRIWLNTPVPLHSFRQEALALFPHADPTDRLALQWGMTLVAYPFFADMVATIGRLGALQGTVSRQQIRRRITEMWGERTTIERAWPRAIATLLNWKVIERTHERDVYRIAEPVAVADQRVRRWLLEAHYIARGDGSIPFVDLVHGPALFPFRLSLSAYDLRNHPRLDVVRLGLDEDVVVRKDRSYPSPGVETRDPVRV